MLKLFAKYTPRLVCWTHLYTGWFLVYVSMPSIPIRLWQTSQVSLWLWALASSRMQDSHSKHRLQRCATCYMSGSWGHWVLLLDGLLIDAHFLQLSLLSPSPPSVWCAVSSIKSSLSLGMGNEDNWWKMAIHGHWLKVPVYLRPYSWRDVLERHHLSRIVKGGTSCSFKIERCTVSQNYGVWSTIPYLNLSTNHRAINNPWYLQACSGSSYCQFACSECVPVYWTACGYA